MKRRIISMLLGVTVALGAMLSGVQPVRAESAPAGDSGLLWLVNYGHAVSSTYVASDMRTVKGSSVQMRSAAAEALEKMNTAMRSAGLSVGMVSGYRTYARQQYLFTTRMAEKQKNGMTYDQAYAATRRFTAVPGTSEHQVGLAIDVSTNGSLSSAFANTAQGKWLKENCWKYGFILRYDESKINFTQIGEEPWHFRYVGAPHAQIMYEKGWCFEEYIDELKSRGYISLTEGNMIYEVYRTEGAAGEYQNVIDRSADNSGGVIVTTYHPADPMAYIKGHWSEGSFAELFGGTAPERFGVIDPARTITRGEFADLYALQLPEAERTVSFADVAKDYPHYEGVTAVASAGIMNGNDGKFRPNGVLTRQEAAVAAAASVSEDGLQYLDYSDVGDIAGWAFQSVQKLARQDIMKGAEGKFRPTATLTWGEAAALLCKLREYREK